MRILGIDPGSRVTGFGVVERSQSGVAHVVHGTLRPPRSGALSDRLGFLYQGIRDIVRANTPDAAVVEQVFVASSARSALVLGHARGVALAALASEQLAVSEISARQVKKAVVGNGAATKAQVQSMVAILLELEVRPASDAADALAAAIALAHAGRLASLQPPLRRRRRRPRPTRFASRRSL